MDNTTAYGSSCLTTLNRIALGIGGIIAFSLILIVSLVGNSFIALVVYKTQHMRKPINYFITNMAISDLMLPIFLFPMRITDTFLESWPITGPLGQALCKLYLFIPYVSAAVSIHSLILIAVDRLGAVVFPLRPPLISPKWCPLFILATWVIAVAVISPYLFAFRLVEYQGIQMCQARWKQVFGESFSEENYLLSLNIACFFYIPISLLIILYSIIVFKLKTQKHPGEQSVIAEKQRARRNRNVLKMAIAIVLGFVLCFFPWSIFILLIRFAWDNRLYQCNITASWTIAWLMATSNCAVNPCICFIFCRNYRQGFKKLLKCNKSSHIDLKFVNL